MPARIGTIDLAYNAPGMNTCRNAIRTHTHTHPTPRHVLVAYSGGPDSTALLAALIAEGHTTDALIVDHGLHPNHQHISAAAASLAEALGANPHILPVTVTPPNTEARARTARYQAISTWARNNPHIPPHLFIGHTADDQAETVLIGMLRANPQGMAPTTSRHGLTLHRPLLAARRADTHAACAELAIEDSGQELFRDPTNYDPAYRRGQLRTRLLPELADIIGGDPIPALACAGDRIAADAHALDALTPTIEPGTRLPIDRISHLPQALRHRALAAFLRGGGANPTSASIHAIDRLVTHYSGQGPIAVAAASPTRGRRLVVTRARGMLELAPAPPPTPKKSSP